MVEGDGNLHWEAFSPSSIRTKYKKPDHRSDDDRGIYLGHELDIDEHNSSSDYDGLKHYGRYCTVVNKRVYDDKWGFDPCNGLSY